MKNFNLWQQLASEYAELMHEAVDQTFKVWQVPVPHKTYEESQYAGQMSHHNGSPKSETVSPAPPPQNNPVVSESPPEIVEPPPPEPSPAAAPATETKTKKSSSTSNQDENVWNYRGYHLGGGNFTTAMVHFFRAEIYRSDLWRRRLDTTTNWAVITTAATLSLAWDPRVIILNTLLITLFLYIEARRYRYYELWTYRVRLMETDFFAAMLVPPFRPSPDWAENLAESLLYPKFPVSMWEAFGRRFRNNYVWIYTILWMAWLLSNWIHPTPAVSWSNFIERAAIGQLPGWLVLMIGFLFNSVLIIIGLITMRLQETSGEILPHKGIFSFFEEDESTSPQPSRRNQVMATIITQQSEMVSERILQDMGRGVTAMPGTSMHKGDNRTVLLCPLTMPEMKRLKSTVKMVDPQAMVITLPANDVAGINSMPL